MCRNRSNFGKISFNGTLDRLFKKEEDSHVLSDLKTSKTGISGKVNNINPKFLELKDVIKTYELELLSTDKELNKSSNIEEKPIKEQ